MTHAPSDGRRRLLFLVADAPFFVTHRLSLAHAAREAGYDVHVAVPFEDRPVAAIRAAGVHCHDLPLRRGNRSLGGELRLIVAVARLFRAVRPDLVHAVSLKPVIFGGLVARLLGVPAAVLAVTGLGYLFLRPGAKTRVQRAVIKRLYRFALGHPRARAIFQNPDDLALFVGENLVDPAITVMIKGCGVDTERFGPTAEPAGPVVVMFPARVIGDKGVREFVAAAGILRRQGVTARFVLVGRTDPENPTDVGEPAIRAWEAIGDVEWWGFREDMASVLAQAHIVCMPSYMEGLPRVLIEAAACARPVVTTDVPGCREIVRDGENGLLVPPRDGAATAVALGRLIADRALRAKFGARGRAIATGEFTVERFVAETLALYRTLMPARADAGAAAIEEGR